MKNILSPKIAYNKITTYISEIRKKSKYYSILDSLDKSEKFKDIGFQKIGKNLYVGIDLDPTLLRPDYFDDEARNSAELKFISEKLKKYTDFMNKEGILDYSIADYDRVYDKKDYYGYIVEIRFDDRKINKSNLIHGIVYFSSVLAIATAVSILSFFYITI